MERKSRTDGRNHKSATRRMANARGNQVSGVNKKNPENESSGVNKYLKEELDLILASLKSSSFNDPKCYKRNISYLESLFSILNLNKRNDGKCSGDFSVELSVLDKFLVAIHHLLSDPQNFIKDVFECQNLILKNFNCLLKLNNNLESPWFVDVLEHMIDCLIRLKIVICKLMKDSENDRKNDDILLILNGTCLLLLKCIYVIASKYKVKFDQLKLATNSGKFVGIIRCFMFYGLNLYDLNMFPDQLYPSPLGQLMTKDQSWSDVNSSSSKKRRSKINEDDIFDEDNGGFRTYSPNLSASEYSSSELDESFSMLDMMEARIKHQNKKIYSRIRLFAYECLQASLTSVFDIRTLFGYWSFLFPDCNSTPNNHHHHHHHQSTIFSILTTISDDPSVRVRSSALNFMFDFFDDGKQYVQILVQDAHVKSGGGGGGSTTTTLSFTPMSVSFTAMIKELHKFFQYILLKETNCSVLILSYKVLSLIISITPYRKFHQDILHPLFYQNGFLLDDKVIQIKNLSLALCVKLFSLPSLPEDFESWILDHKLGRETMNKVLRHCYEFIGQDFILLIIESIKLFISILKHHHFALKLFASDSIEFDINRLNELSFSVVNMDKALSNSVLQNLLCKFHYSIGSFLKELCHKDAGDLFPDKPQKMQFIQQWYSEFFNSKLFHEVLVRQDMTIIQTASQETLINTISLIPDEIFAMFPKRIRYNIISILISLSKIDDTILVDESSTTNVPDPDMSGSVDSKILCKSTSIRCLSILQSYRSMCEDLDLCCDLIDICLDVVAEPSDLQKLSKKKQILLLEHILWALANILDSIKKNDLQSQIEEAFLNKIARLLKNLFADISHPTDDVLINLSRNSGIIIYLILSRPKKNPESIQASTIVSESNNDNPPVFTDKPTHDLDPTCFIEMIDRLIEILSRKKSYKLQWNICICFSYLLPLKPFVELCSQQQQQQQQNSNQQLTRIFNVLHQTFLTTINYKVQSYSIYTCCTIVSLNHFGQVNLKQLWTLMVDKFIKHLNAVPGHLKKSWLEKFSFSLEKFHREFVIENIHQDNDVHESFQKLLEFIEQETQMQHAEPYLEQKLIYLYDLFRTP